MLVVVFCTGGREEGRWCEGGKASWGRRMMKQREGGGGMEGDGPVDNVVVCLLYRVQFKATLSI